MGRRDSDCTGPDTPDLEFNKAHRTDLSSTKWNYLKLCLSISQSSGCLSFSFTEKIWIVLKKSLFTNRLLSFIKRNVSKSRLWDNILVTRSLWQYFCLSAFSPSGHKGKNCFLSPQNTLSPWWCLFFFFNGEINVFCYLSNPILWAIGNM